MKSAVLFVSSCVEDARALAPMLEAVDIQLSSAADLKQTKTLLESGLFGAVVTEVSLPDGTWKDVVGLAGRVGGGVAVVVTALLADAGFWVDVLEFGAYDLLSKPFCCGEVQRVLKNAVDRPTLLIAAALAGGPSNPRTGLRIEHSLAENSSDQTCGS